jgi:chaperonin cofactor prefoldin
VFLRKHYETKLIQEAKAKVESLELEVANLTEESVSKMRPQELQYNIQKVLSRGREIREDLKLIQSD